MGVVDEHSERLALVDRLEAAGHLLGRLERLGRAGEVQPESVGDGERGERVLDVEVAGKRRAHVDLGAIGPAQVKR